MNNLKPIEYIDFAPEGSGEQVYNYHQSCDAVPGNGTDHKPRLAIKRAEDGYTILAHCHHCGKSGRTRENRWANKKGTRGISSRSGGTSHTRGSLPPDSLENPGEWPSEARAWIYRGRVGDETAKRYGLMYSPDKRKVILPIYRKGKLLGYQERKVYPKDPGPKYVTRRFDKELFWCNNIGVRNKLVLVEDILSAIRLAEIGVHSIALLGTTLKDYILYYIINNYNNIYNIYIWLDNNNTQVKSNQLKIKRKLDNYYNNIKLVLTDLDPKEYTDRDLNKYVLLGT